MHLEMKTRCEKCRRPLSAGGEAFICSFECTFCAPCAAALHNSCPNCGGELVARPRRTVSFRGRTPLVEQTALHIRSALVWSYSFAIWAFVWLVSTLTIYQMYRVSGPSSPIGSVAAMEFGQMFSYFLLSPFAFQFALRYPLQRRNWMRHAALHLLAGMIFTFGHVALRGFAPYGYWDPVHREFTYAFWDKYLHTFRDPWVVLRTMFLGNVVDDTFGAYVPIVVIAQALGYYSSLQEKESRASHLEAQLAKVHLQTLKSQLEPHFLFNTLHSISALMLSDVKAADRMMSTLSDLLRMSLESGAAQLTTLDREVEFLGLYLEIEKARLEDHLKVSYEISPECLDAQVPHLLLQPLVENAVRHGISKCTWPGEIRVTARPTGSDLCIWIRDNGPGIVQGAGLQNKQGLGLSITQERLRALYGDNQRCELRNVSGGGTEVYVQLPLSLAPPIPATEGVTQGT